MSSAVGVPQNRCSYILKVCVQAQVEVEPSCVLSAVPLLGDTGRQLGGAGRGHDVPSSCHDCHVTSRHTSQHNPSHCANCDNTITNNSHSDMSTLFPSNIKT